MKDTRILMGMPVTVEIADSAATAEDIEAVYEYFHYVDEKFSTYKDTSEISQLNRRELTLAEASQDLRTVFELAEQTRQETDGYFDIARDGRIDPSGLVKGWAIDNAANLLRDREFQNFYVDAGGDIEAAGYNRSGQKWRVGIRNPFNLTEIVKVLAISDGGIATSGNYVRGQHIYRPDLAGELETDIVSLTVVGPNVYDADRYATAAFAMGREGILFIDRMEGFEAYMIDQTGQAIYTPGLERYIVHD